MFASNPPLVQCGTSDGAASRGCSNLAVQVSRGESSLALKADDPGLGCALTRVSRHQFRHIPACCQPRLRQSMVVVWSIPTSIPTVVERISPCLRARFSRFWRPQGRQTLTRRSGLPNSPTLACEMWKGSSVTWVDARLFTAMYRHRVTHPMVRHACCIVPKMCKKHES